MPKPDANPATPITDPELTIDERLTALEALVKTLADHQVNLGTSLIRAHATLIETSADLAAAGIARESKGEKQQQPSSVVVNRAPLIDPGGHPLRRQ